MMYEGAVQNQIKDWDDILGTHVGMKSDGTFVEVGAFDGVQWSPCRPLALAGWAGVFFEPVSKHYAALERNYKDFSGVRCIRKAISDHVGDGEIYIGGSISTLEKESRDLYLEIEEFRSTGHGLGKRQFVRISTLDEELSAIWPDGRKIDVVSIDVEGSEVKVLNGFSLDRWRPTIIAIEAHEHYDDSRLSAKAVQINAHMEAAGYDKIYSDHINNVYVRRSA